MNIANTELKDRKNIPGQELSLGAVKKTSAPIRILHLEDDSKDALLIQSILKTEGIAVVTRCVSNRVDFVIALEHGGIDLILADFSIPDFGRLEALEIVRKRWPAIPLIFVSGTVGEEQ